MRNDLGPHHICDIGMQGAFNEPLFDRLRRTFVETVSEATLHRFVENRAASIIEGNPATSIATLFSLIFSRVHHELTAYDIWNELKTLNLTPNRWGSSPPVLAAVEEQTHGTFPIDPRIDRRLCHRGSCRALSSPREQPVSSGGPYARFVFALGKDFEMYFRVWAFNKWAPPSWQSLGGKFKSDPAAVTWAPDRIDIFGIGMNGAMYHKALTAQGWQPSWESLGGSFVSAPAAVTWGPNRLDVFATGTDGAMYHKAWWGSSWGGWESLGGKFVSLPVVASIATNRLDILGIGTNREMYHKAWDGSGWSGWESLGGKFVARPRLDGAA